MAIDPCSWECSPVRYTRLTLAMPASSLASLARPSGTSPEGDWRVGKKKNLAGARTLPRCSNVTVLPRQRRTAVKGQLRAEFCGLSPLSSSCACN